MKVKFIKQKAIYIDGVKLFNAGQEVEIPSATAKSLIHTKHAVEVKAEKPKEQPKKEQPKKEEPKVEAKQLRAKREDKQLKTSDKEDK